MTTTIRATQLTAEALQRGTLPGALCTHLSVEILQPRVTTVAMTQMMVEVLMGTTSIVWPITLPVAPRKDDLGESPGASIIRSENDTGPDKVRRRAVAMPREFNFIFDMTRTQKEAFDAFYNGPIACGALPYIFKNPSTGNLAEFRIVGKPDYKPLVQRSNGGEPWRVAFKAELMPGTEAAP